MVKRRHEKWAEKKSFFRISLVHDLLTSEAKSEQQRERDTIGRRRRCRASLCNSSIFRPTCRKTAVLLHVNQPIGYVEYNGISKLKYISNLTTDFSGIPFCRTCILQKPCTGQRPQSRSEFDAIGRGNRRRAISHVPVEPTVFVAYNTASILWCRRQIAAYQSQPSHDDDTCGGKMIKKRPTIAWKIETDFFFLRQDTRPLCNDD